MKKPNIIFLIQDQMQQRVLREDSGCIMPNMQALMRDSVVFDQAHTCNAICSPSRASLLTGVMPHNHGMIDCTHTVPPYRAEYDASLDTITQALHDEGYHVSYFGKWHVERTNKLETFGVDVYETEVDVPKFKVTIKDKVMLTTPGYADKMVCGVFTEGSDSTEERYIYEKAIADIEAHRNQDNPFCTFISTYAPHDPYCVPQEIYDLYENVNLTLPRSFSDNMEDKPAIYRRMKEALTGLSEADYLKSMRCYYSYCTLVDVQVGKLVQYLKDNDLYDNTIIVFMSDHGDMMGAHGLMMKSVPAFEEVYHIPLVMKLPGQVRAGQHADFHINTYEIAPTVLELAGCRPLKGSQVAPSMVPWITGEKQDGHYAFAEFFGQRYAFTQRIYWKDNFKYVFNAFDEDELYDLKADPDEIRNLNHHPDYQEVKRSMCSQMWEIIKNTGDDTLADAEYFLLRIAPVGPGPKNQNKSYSIYNKSF